MDFPITDPVLIFSFAIVLALMAPLLSSKIKIPSIIGLITAGMIIGPHLTGLLERDSTMELLGTIGLLYIMFQAGLEINIEQLKRDKHHTIIFGLATFAIPLFMGTTAAYFTLELSLVASILLSSMFSSHTLLTFPIVSKLGLSKKRSVTTTVGGTIVTDTLALLVLAVIIASHEGDVSLFFWIKLFVSIAIYSILTIWILPRAGSWFFRNFSSETGVEDYVFIFAAMLISAFFSHIAGLEPIIGAFLAGLTLNTLIPEKSILMNRIQFVGNSMFIPFFLISTGMLIDPWLLLTDNYTIKVTIIMVVIALISKYFAAELFGRFQSYDPTERGIVYGMSVNQAAATLAAVIVGYNVGIFNEAILTGTIIMILCTSFVGSIFTEKFAKRLILESTENYDHSSKKLLNRILIPISHPESVNSMMDLAVYLHPDKSEEPLYPLHIALEGPSVQKQIIEGENILTKATIRANTLQRPTIPLIKIDYNVPGGILEAIKEHRISKIIMGWNEPTNFKHSFYDSIMEQIVKSSHEMIFISRSVQPLNITERIILVIPPFINKQYGFIDTIRTLNKFTKALSSRLIIFTEEKTANEIKYLFKKDEVNPDFIHISSWKRITEDIKKIISGKDMLIQMIAREGRLAWRMSFDQLPYKLKQSFSNNNLLVVYPYYHIEDSEIDTELYSEDLSLLYSIPKENFLINVSEDQITDIFKKIVHFPYFNHPDKVYDQLLTVLKEYPIELTPDVVLIHVHTKEVDRSHLFPIVNRNGFEIQSIGAKPRIILILAVQEDQPVQEHLNTLSQISRMVMVNKLTENIISADNYSEFMELMRLDLLSLQ